MSDNVRKRISFPGANGGERACAEVKGSGAASEH